MCYYCVFLCYRQTCSTVAIPGNRCWGYCALCHHLHLREEEEPWDGGWSWWWWWSCVSALYISWSSVNFEWDKMQNWSANQLFWLKKVLENCVKNEQSSVLLIKSFDEVLTKIQVWVNNKCWCFFGGGGLSFQLAKVTMVKYTGIQYPILNCSTTEVKKKLCLFRNSDDHKGKDVRQRNIRT